MFQKLHAVHNFPLATTQSGGVSTSGLPSPSIITAAKTTSQTPQSGGEAAASGGSPSVLQSSFPQGSILVVPHPTSPFHAVLPVFANTAVIMPPGGGGGATAAITAGSSSSPAPSSSSVQMTAGAGVAAVVPQAIPGSVTGAGGGRGGGIPSQPQQAIAIDGRLLGMGVGGATIPGSGAESNQMIQLVQQAMASAGVATAFVQQPSQDSMAGAGKQDPAGGNKEKAVVIQQPSALQYKDYQKYLALTGLSMPQPVYTMTVQDAVELVKINFESKSIEITGEVPITKIDTETISPEKLSTMMRDSREGAELKVGSGSNTDRKKEDERKGIVTEPVKDGMIEIEQKTDTVNVIEIPTSVDETKGKNVNSGVVAAEETVGGDSFRGHSTADILSAELLLSLTGNSSKSWPTSSPLKGSPMKPGAALNDSTLLTASSGASPHTPSTGRKRKQKPIASAKPAAAEEGNKTAGSPASAKKRRPRKKKKDEEEGEEPVKQVEPKGGTGLSKSKQFTPDELLEILNIPSSAKPGAGGKGPGKGRGKAGKDQEPMSVSKASAKMEELKASRMVKPMKEYVIETDSDSNSSSSSSSSNGFTPTSSDSSSDSSSNDDSSEPKVKTPVQKPPARGRGRGRGKDRKLAERSSSSSDDSSSEEDDERDKKPRKGVAAGGRRGGRGGKRGGATRGRGGHTSSQRGHVVSIPTRLIKTKMKQKKKVKLNSTEVREASVRLQGDLLVEVKIYTVDLFGTAVLDRQPL